MNNKTLKIKKAIAKANKSVANIFNNASLGDVITLTKKVKLSFGLSAIGIVRDKNTLLVLFDDKTETMVSSLSLADKYRLANVINKGEWEVYDITEGEVYIYRTDKQIKELAELRKNIRRKSLFVALVIFEFICGMVWCVLGAYGHTINSALGGLLFLAIAMRDKENAV